MRDYVIGTDILQLSFKLDNQKSLMIEWTWRNNWLIVWIVISVYQGKIELSEMWNQYDGLIVKAFIN